MMFSTTSRPFLEENDVSEQVVKSIYAEDQVNDGQTQRTGQIMVSCAAVQAEHTVSVPTEELSVSLSSTSSSHLKETQHNPNYYTLYDPDASYNKWLSQLNLPLLQHPQTLYSFLKHINNFDFTWFNLYKNAFFI